MMDSERAFNLTRQEREAQCVVVLGSRRSKLALVQTEAVKGDLERRNPEWRFFIKEISTVGDKILDKPLSQIGDKGLFTKELEEALFREEIDLAVHSLKDVQTTLPEGLYLGAISEREDQRDALVLKSVHKTKGWKTLGDLPAGSVVGTSSLRRVAQLKRGFPQLEFKTIRGNLQTRLSKLESDTDGFDGIILAFAGLNRLGLSDSISSVLTPELCFPAVGQGALAVECREGDQRIRKLLRSSIHHPETALCCHAERGLMRHLQGGCLTPIAVWCQVQGEREGKRTLVIQGRVLSLDGKDCIHGEEQVVLSGGEGDDQEEDVGKALGIKLAESLLSKGAGAILSSIARENPHLNAPPTSVASSSST